LAGLSKKERKEHWQATLSKPGSREIVLVAVAGRRVVGFASCGPEREGDPQHQGEVYAIYVHPRKQFRGVGRALFLAAVDCLLLAGFHSLLVWALAANPYRRFYESLGGEPVRRRSIQIGGRRLEEIGYGWDDIRPLAPPFVLLLR
jgi:GNAT superfamily N-acetyltransferase